MESDILFANLAILVEQKLGWIEVLRVYDSEKLPGRDSIRAKICAVMAQIRELKIEIEYCLDRERIRVDPMEVDVR